VARRTLLELVLHRIRKIRTSVSGDTAVIEHDGCHGGERHGRIVVRPTMRVTPDGVTRIGIGQHRIVGFDDTGG
jgi:hypothetical protein